MKRRGKNKLFAVWKTNCIAGLALAAIFAAGSAWGEGAYLYLVGVPDLRFQAVTTNYFVFNSKPESEPSRAKSKETATISGETTNAVKSLAEAASAHSTNSTAAFSALATATNRPNQNLTASASSAGDDEKKNWVQPFNTGISSPAASDLLTVTPQMIADYLKPNANAANPLDHHGVVVFVPSDSQFIPPTPGNAGESRATYHSQ